MNSAYLSLGTNLGNREENLKKAIEKIEERVGHVKAQSAFLPTEPWGFQSENSFLNAVLVSTYFEEENLLRNYGFREQNLIKSGMPRYDYIEPRLRERCGRPRWDRRRARGLQNSMRRRLHRVVPSLIPP